MANLEEQKLISKSQKGDLTAFEELILKYEKKVFNITLRIIGNYNEAEDISQEIFLKVFKSIGGFKGNSSFYTWLYRISVNECMDYVKKRNKTQVYSIDAPYETEDHEIKIEIKDKSESIEERIERKELRDFIISAMNKLSVEFRSVIVLRDIQGFSYEEIASILNCAEGTVKSRISRARKALKQVLSSEEELTPSGP